MGSVASERVTDLCCTHHYSVNVLTAVRAVESSVSDTVTLQLGGAHRCVSEHQHLKH